jgi:hypothetical protein
MRNCPCKSNRILYVREDIQELDALSRKFEQDIPFDKERGSGSYNEAEMIDLNAEPVQKFGIRQDISDNREAISSSVANYGKNSVASVSVYHEASRPAGTRVSYSYRFKNTFPVSIFQMSNILAHLVLHHSN